MGLQVNDKFSTKTLIIGGMLAGFISGIIMGATAMIRAGVTGAGFWLPPKLIAAFVLGIDALTSGTGGIILGLGIHFITSLFFGFLFAIFIQPVTTYIPVFVSGVMYSIAIWAIMTFVGLPLVNELTIERAFGLNPNWWFFYHVIYGASLTSILPICRKLEHQPFEENKKRYVA